MWCYDPALFRRRSRAAHNEEALSSYFQARSFLATAGTPATSVRRDVLYNNCACGHYGTVSDFDIAKYHTMCTQPDIVADHYRTGLMALDPDRMS
jgi:hypothetical protein